jgi:oligoendopeptidase F
MMHFQAVAEAVGGRRKAALGKPPEWDLSDLYPSPDSRALTRDLAQLTDDAEVFHPRYEGRLADLSGVALGAAVETYERLQELSGRITSYASLMHSGNLADPEIGRFYQMIQERINAISTTLLFFTLELNRLDDAELEAKETGPALARYRPWLRDIRAFRQHQLSDEVEKLLHRIRLYRRTRTTT